ncbi:MAG TPA: DUF58 domain-containing protein [Pirellulaceae bacterium]|nr:DUF58 domain-containing protein [Pirellulaceae bacterium]HMO92360.1 DUF58 domain-containing protein [Pirellulaceae bacterium]HMP71308.1 DUF58 domain-containing protein [Pirellulaceae bacterium]
MDRIRNILTTDFCPWANKYVYWLKQPIGWYALAAVASLLTGMYVSSSGWTVLACCLVVIAIQLAWPWVQLKMCACEVSFDCCRASEWSANLVRVQITNRGPFPLWGLAIEKGFFLPEAGSPNSENQVAVTLSRIAPFSSNTYVWRFVPPRRGVYPLEQPRLSTAFPFGIWTAFKDVTVRGQLLVWPKTTVLQRLPVVEAWGIAPLGALRDQPGDQGDILGSRVWQPGESLRMVNWAQTSRSEEDLIVLERQTCARPGVQVSIDLTPHRDLDRRQEVWDWQIRIAASLAEFFHGHQFDLRAGYANVNQVIGASRAGIHAWFDDLSRLNPEEYCDQCAAPGPARHHNPYLVSNATAWCESTDKESRYFVILVATKSDQDIRALPDRGFVIDLDHPTQDPFTQLITSWRANQRAQQAI